MSPECACTHLCVAFVWAFAHVQTKVAVPVCVCGGVQGCAGVCARRAVNCSLRFRWLPMLLILSWKCWSRTVPDSSRSFLQPQRKRWVQTQPETADYATHYTHHRQIFAEEPHSVTEGFRWIGKSSLGIKFKGLFLSRRTETICRMIYVRTLSYNDSNFQVCLVVILCRAFTSTSAGTRVKLASILSFLTQFCLL